MVQYDHVRLEQRTGKASRCRIVRSLPVSTKRAFRQGYRRLTGTLHEEVHHMHVTSRDEWLSVPELGFALLIAAIVLIGIVSRML